MTYDDWRARGPHEDMPSVEDVEHDEPEEEGPPMNAFEEALVAVMAKRAKAALSCMSLHDQIASDEPGLARRVLGDVHLMLSQLQEDIRCLQRLHEMADAMTTEEEQ